MIVLEQQVENRLRLERAESRRDTYGLIAAFVLAAAIIVGGIYLIATGHDWAGGSIITVNLVSLVGVFVYRSRNGRNPEG